MTNRISAKERVKLAKNTLDQWEHAEFAPPSPASTDYLSIAVEYLNRNSDFNRMWAEGRASAIDYGPAYRARRKAWSDCFQYMSDACSTVRADLDAEQAENQRLRRLIWEGCDLLSVEVDALKEGISIGGVMEPSPEDKHTVAAISELESWIDRAGRAALRQKEGGA